MSFLRLRENHIKGGPTLPFPDQQIKDLEHVRKCFSSTEQFQDSYRVAGCNLLPFEFASSVKSVPNNAEHVVVDNSTGDFQHAATGKRIDSVLRLVS
jgi:hypothetical protein